MSRYVWYTHCNLYHQWPKYYSIIFNPQHSTPLRSLLPHPQLEELVPDCTSWFLVLQGHLKVLELAVMIVSNLEALAHARGIIAAVLKAAQSIPAHFNSLVYLQLAEVLVRQKFVDY